MTGIRADANETVATGHIMRCITIAKELKTMGEDILFFTADEYAAPMLRQAGMDYLCLHTQWDQPEEEIPVLSEEIKKAGCDRLLVDSYQATPEYLGALAKECKVIYIDDMFDDIYPVDMIINYNAYHTRFPYRQSYDQNTRLLLGSGFVPLREEFSHFSDFLYKETLQEQREQYHIFLSCGGGDVYNALAGILNQVTEQEEQQLKLPPVIFHTVVGRFHQNIDVLERLAAKHPQIRLYRNVSEMAPIMGSCEMAVSAAGTVLYELCAMQIPTVFFVCAENQKYDSHFFADEDRMIFAGDIRTDRESCINTICDGIRRLLSNDRLRQTMRKKLHEVTDGKGAVRIAEAIKEM